MNSAQSIIIVEKDRDRALLSVLSVNGTMIGVSLALAERARAMGYAFDFARAMATGRALLAAADGPLRIGVPFPFSMHAELIHYWLAGLGQPAPGIVTFTVPLPLMAQALAMGEIDAFCVGEPKGSVAVETGVGALLLPDPAIWAFAPDKVLAVRQDWAAAHPDRTARLIRAVWRAGRNCLVLRKRSRERSWHLWRSRRNQGGCILFRFGPKVIGRHLTSCFSTFTGLAGHPLAATIGYGTSAHIVTPFSMDLNGNAITMSNEAWDLMKPQVPLGADGLPEHPISATALTSAIDQFAADGKPFNLGILFPVSTHNYELRYWLAAGGINPGLYSADDVSGTIGADVLLSVTPPPQMPATLEAACRSG